MLEFQPDVLVVAGGAPCDLGSRGIERIAADAVERPFAALELEAPVITAIVVEPKTEEDRGHEDAVDDRSGGKLEHCAQRSLPANAGRQKNAPDKPARSLEGIARTE